MIAAKKNLVRCAVYTRVSTDDQAQGDYNSLESQRDICQHAIGVHQHEGWEITRQFDDPGFSGKNMERPGMQSLIHAVERGEIDVVVTYKIDRITRYLPDFYEFWRLLERHQVHFVSATQSFDTATPAGTLMLNMLLSFGQFEREQTVERITHKMAERAKRGKWAGGIVPLGFDYDPATKTLSPHPSEGPLIKRIFKMAVELRNATVMANQLNDEGLRTKERVFKTKDGAEKRVGGTRFRSDKLKELVANPLYKGLIRHKDEEYPGEHEALVSKRLWDQANLALRDLKEELPPVRERDRYHALLKGIARCGYCGNLLTPHPSGKKDPQGGVYLYYICGDVSRHGSHSGCPLRNVPARPFEKIVVDFIGQLGNHPEVIQAALAASNAAKQKSLRPLKSKLAKLTKKFNAVHNRLRRYLDLAGSDNQSFSQEMMAEAGKLSEEKRALDIQREQVKTDIEFRQRVMTDHETVAQGLRHFGETFQTLPYEDQKELLGLVVKSIRVTKFDTGKDRLPGGNHVIPLKVRTSWLSLKFEIFANDLLPVISRNGASSSTLVPFGARSGT